MSAATQIFGLLNLIIYRCLLLHLFCAFSGLHSVINRDPKGILNYQLISSSSCVIFDCFSHVCLH